MTQRVNLDSEVKSYKGWSRSESESEQGGELSGLDPKPGELPMVRVKVA